MAEDRLAGKVAIVTGAAKGQGAGVARAFAAAGARVALLDVLDAGGEATAAALSSRAARARFLLRRRPRIRRRGGGGRGRGRVRRPGRPLQQRGGDRVREKDRRAPDGRLGADPGDQSHRAVPLRDARHPASRAARRRRDHQRVVARSLPGVAGRHRRLRDREGRSRHPDVLPRLRVRRRRDPRELHRPWPGPDRSELSLPRHRGGPSPDCSDDPLGRVGDIEDIARAAVFLASDEARWITGAVLRVDGGIVVQ